MPFVFYVHSHITFLIAATFIEQNRIEPEDIIYITSRNYHIHSQNKKLNISKLYSYLEEHSKVNKLFNLKAKIRDLDANLGKLVNGAFFRLYIPQFNHSIFQILATHELCSETILIEEGITSYKKDKNLYKQASGAFMDRLFNRFSKRIVLNNGHYNPVPMQKFRFALGLNEQVFPFIQRKKIVVPQSEMFPTYDRHTLDGDTLFILDSFAERTKIKKTIYHDLNFNLISNLNPKPSLIRVKFHPEQDQHTRQETILNLRDKFDDINIVEMDDDCIVELEFLKSKNLNIIGYHSSLLFYAKSFNHHVVSGIRDSMRYPKIRQYIDHIMDDFQLDEIMSYE